MLRYLVLLLILQGACHAPTKHFRQSPVSRIAVDGALFDVRVRGNLAEAIRRNPQYAPRLGPLRDQAGFAMARVSGCRVRDVLGDQALMVGVLDCDGGTAVPVRPAVRLQLDCIEVSDRVLVASDPGFIDYDCTSY